jgi:MFS family permease
MVSQVGTVVQGIGIGWLVVRLHGGGVGLGLVAAAQFLPLFLVGPFGGVIADRRDKRRLLLVTQSGMTLTATTLALLAVRGHPTLLGVGLVVLMQGVFGAVDGPVRGVLVAEIVGPRRLANAISLQEVSISTARVVGPLLAGALIPVFGVSICFLVNAASFVPVLVGVWLLEPAPARARPTGGLSHPLAGLVYAWRRASFRWLLLLATAIGAFFNFGIVMPLLAHDTFDGGPQALAAMIGAVGAGAIVGSLVLASADDPTPTRLERLGVATALALLLDAVAPAFGWELVALAVTGAAGVSLVAVVSALLQLRCDPALRGRLSALWTVAIVGSAVLTGPILGTLATVSGPRTALGAIGVAVLMATIAPRKVFRAELSASRASGHHPLSFEPAGATS